MEWITKLVDRLTGHTRVILTETERALVLEKGQICALLGPGEHRLNRKMRLQEVYDVNALSLTSEYLETLLGRYATLASEHLTEVKAGEAEVVVVLRDGKPVEVLHPLTRVAYWTAAGPWTVERYSVEDTLALPKGLAKRLVAVGVTEGYQATEVSEGYIGMLTVDGEAQGVLPAGTHAFWKLGRRVAVKQVDLRQRTHEVTGQEILTRDRVTLRVNLTAIYRVVDPERAVSTVKDFEEALHRSLQLAFRKTLGAMTLDQLLAEKVTVDAKAAGTVRSEMAALGVEVGEIALKDVILPGDMRDILTSVVAAQKEAEANVIRRREETNATRSLLNTAKVMAENPVMLRLKELEALESIAGKVERLTVHNGTEGLMSDLVKLRD